MNQNQSQRWIIIYDSECQLCRGQIGKIKRNDIENIFEYLPNDEPEILSKYPQLKGKDLNASLYLISPEGILYDSADAVYQIMRRLDKYKKIAWLYRLPLIHWFAQKIYRWIARHRKSI